MAEDHVNDFQGDPKESSEENKKNLFEEDSDIIELSDIAIGTTPEDEVIVELTEELIDEAMDGISGATHDSFKEGEDYLDLSKIASDKESRFKDDELHKQKVAEEADDHITQELDVFFGSEDEPSAPVENLIQTEAAQAQPEAQKSGPAFADSNLVEALETVIQKMYGDKISQLLADAIEKTVKNEINRIRDFLAGKIQK
jgi:hypothetical protein